jgi:hypothetical protein
MAAVPGREDIGGPRGDRQLSRKKFRGKPDPDGSLSPQSSGGAFNSVCRSPL